MDWVEKGISIAENIAFALVVFIIGWFVVKSVTAWIERRIEKSKLDENLKPFISGMIGAGLKVLLVLSVINILGIPTTSFVAVIAAAGFAIGLAFQGSLSNFAGGVLLLTLRPFKTGDYIEGAGFSGTVRSIQILYTVLTTDDNKVIYIPNGNLSNSGIVNHSAKSIRRVDLTFNVKRDQDSEHVISILKSVINSQSEILHDPEPFVKLTGPAPNAYVYTVRVWTNADHYWTVHYALIETVKKRFEAENIEIP